MTARDVIAEKLNEIMAGLDEPGDADEIIDALLSADESVRLELAGMLMAPGLDAIAMVKAALPAPPSEDKQP